MAGIGAIVEAAGAIGGGIGSVFNTIGAFGQMKEAKRQVEQGKQFAATQRTLFNETYSDLESLAANQAVYKGDIAGYTRAEQEAKRQQQMANRVNPADQIMRDQARQGTSNYIEQASRGARTGVDLMSIAGMGAAAEAQQMQGININSANQRMTAEQRANENLLNSLSRTAAATARERGMEFDSLNRKQNMQFDVAREKGLGLMDMKYNQFQEDLARRGALQNAKASILSGIGDTFRVVGGGIAESNMQSAQMEYLRGLTTT